jgi:nucleoside-diphosphate-sugar epimerase
MAAMNSRLTAIIGGSGFIGTRLCRRLGRTKSADFFIVDKVTSAKYPDKTVIADVRSVAALRTAISDCHVIVNLAAEHRDDVRPISLYDDVNVNGAKNICLVASERGINTILFTSSVAVYGFAPVGTDESGAISPFNDYGRTKYEAEVVLKNWQAEDPTVRTLVIVRPTVAFGEQNRGNVYNLLRQIALNKFLMVGDGNNRKSMAYVENVAAFLEYALATFNPGVHIFNYVDKPDFTMNELVASVNSILGRSGVIRFRIPFLAGLMIGKTFDLFAALTGKRFTVSAIRIKKFCSNTMYSTAVEKTGFISPIKLTEGLQSTVRYEFMESHDEDELFYTE